MRALAVEADRQVAVMAEHAEPIGETFADHPFEEGVSLSDLGTVARSAAVDVVDCQEAPFGFSAACARSAVVVQEQSSALCSPALHVLGDLVWIGELPLLDPSMFREEVGGEYTPPPSVSTGVAPGCQSVEPGAVNVEVFNGDRLFTAAASSGARTIAVPIQSRTSSRTTSSHVSILPSSIQKRATY